MVKPEWGTKRSCMSCASVFYDLNQSPAPCPKCGTLYEMLSLVAKGRKGKAAKGKIIEDDTDEILDIDSDLEIDEDILIDSDSIDDPLDVFATDPDKEDE
jgi:uncharacterized protein (TIGR02300 family)